MRLSSKYDNKRNSAIPSGPDVIFVRNENRVYQGFSLSLGATVGPNVAETRKLDTKKVIILVQNLQTVAIKKLAFKYAY